MFFVFMNSFGELDVTIVMGLCWAESETRLMTSTVSELFHLSNSVLTIEECLRCRLLACCSFDWARAAFLEIVSNSEKLVVWSVVVASFLGFPPSLFFVLVVASLLRCLSWMSCLRLVDIVCLCPVGVHLAVLFLAPLSASFSVSFHLNRFF